MAPPIPRPVMARPAAGGEPSLTARGNCRRPEAAPANDMLLLVKPPAAA